MGNKWGPPVVTVIEGQVNGIKYVKNIVTFYDRLLKKTLEIYYQSSPKYPL
jgi:hypothetical protein